MIDNIKQSNILFLDIETVPQSPVFDDLAPDMQRLWIKKASYIAKKEDDNAESLYGRAGIYAEFGKVICISCGFFHKETFRIKSFYGDDEHEILMEFSNMLNTGFNSNDHFLCAHNGKEFDYPYLARRMIINSIKVPSILDLPGKKPWEVRHLDTLELWKFGDWKNYTSLDLLATILGIETPKGDMDGSMVGKAYWVDKALDKIVQYCEKDTLTVARVYLRFNGLAAIGDDQVIHSDIKQGRNDKKKVY